MSAEIHDRQVEGINGSRDRHGVARITLPLMAKTIAEAFEIGPKKLLGLPEVDRQWSEGEGGLLVVQITYSGEIEGNDQKGDVAIGSITYSLKPKFGEEPIETHPELKTLMEKFGGVLRDGRVVFPAELPQGTKVSGLGSRKSSNNRNPMSGVEKWKPVEVTWTRDYAARRIPGDILSRIGKVITNPPGNPPELPNRTKWLVECPETSDDDSGNVIRVSEIYTLLPEDAPEDFYRAYQR